MPASRLPAAGRWLAKQKASQRAPGTSARRSRRRCEDGEDEEEQPRGQPRARGQSAVGFSFPHLLHSGQVLAIVVLCLLSLFQLRLYFHGGELKPSLRQESFEDVALQTESHTAAAAAPAPALPRLRARGDAQDGIAGGESLLPNALLIARAGGTDEVQPKDAKLRETQKCSSFPGYANDRIVGRAVEFYDLMTPARCAEQCSIMDLCRCWSWKDDGFCRLGKAVDCSYSGTPDDHRWWFGSCSSEVSALNETAGSAASTATGLRARAAARRGPVPVEPAPSPSALEVGPGDAFQCTEQLRTAPVELAGEASANLTDIIPVVVICHARPVYLRRALGSIFRYRQDADRFPVIGSQDGDDEEVARILQAELDAGRLAKHLRYRPAPGTPAGRNASGRDQYQRLAGHYRWAVDALLGDSSVHQQLIVLEEDLEIAPDFYFYFQATLPLLRADPCLFCVSAWSDSGRASLANDTQAVYRTDFFPGLGWMLLKSYWLELRESWPLEFWDEHLRSGRVRRGRHCLRPEVSRTFSFGEVGVSKGQFFSSHLKYIALNTELTNWTSLDLTRVSSSARFNAWLSAEIHDADFVTLEDIAAIKLRADGQPIKPPNRNKHLAILYQDRDWRRYSKFFGLCPDSKHGLRRGAYRGVLAFTWRGTFKVFLVRDWPVLAAK